MEWRNGDSFRERRGRNRERKIDFPTSVLERGRGRYNRERDGFDPIATPNKLSRTETWKVSKWGEGRIGAICREIGTRVGFTGRREGGFHLRFHAVSKGPVCVIAPRVSIVYWIGSYQILETRTHGKQGWKALREENERSPDMHIKAFHRIYIASFVV